MSGASGTAPVAEAAADFLKNTPAAAFHGNLPPRDVAVP